MAFRICLRSLAFYLNCWWRAIRPNRRKDSRITLRRAGFLFILFPLFLILQSVHWVCWMLDAVVFPSTKAVNVRHPIFITGIPRSGTTFVHRSLAHAPKLTTFSTWEAILAPSVCEKRILRGLASIDRRLGRPLRRSADWLIRQFTGDFEAIHGVDLTAPEEDYLALLPFGGCFLLALAFPGIVELRDLARFDEMPLKRRRELLDLYHQCLQKQLFDYPSEVRLLSKNAAFGSWFPDLAERYPDAVFLLCLRSPLEALSSQVSSLAGAREAFGTDPSGRETAELMRQNFQHSYAQIAKLADEPDLQKRCRVLAQRDLKVAPTHVLTVAAEFAYLKKNTLFTEYLNNLQPTGTSAHVHDAASIPGDNREFLEETAASYAAILDLDCRIQPT
jgi:omega-hydroxy-beta-dihydromenaquinone-9 sulfotransferase